MEGTAAELLDPAKTIITINTTNNILAKEILMKSEWQPNLKNNSTEKIILQVDKATIPSIINYLVNNHVAILSAETRHSLEDYFLSLTNPELYVEPATV